ncbi:hypothetical protein HYPSUDRAFT_201375 [Hypholoma sublateritium FD-334 SS-4]|uniref:Uncharacterized protein n=1 Tax=Hypholoma sublateritium (strain FD-334 SS-4) TaxID=945553 RepID=A0A0D2L824_HYPSF|nr:hypothetical protein HYPSUDRAFT_201375 [Hypholoma sublateritium FD-334 SS-4]
MVIAHASPSISPSTRTAVPLAAFPLVAAVPSRRHPTPSPPSSLPPSPPPHLSSRSTSPPRQIAAGPPPFLLNTDARHAQRTVVPARGHHVFTMYSAMRRNKNASNQSEVRKQALCCEVENALSTGEPHHRDQGNSQPS